MTDDRIARIERGIGRVRAVRLPAAEAAALADLRAWQEIAERHGPVVVKGVIYCLWCGDGASLTFPCPDRESADAALDRLDALWGESRG